MRGYKLKIQDEKWLLLIILVLKKLIGEGKFPTEETIAFSKKILPKLVDQDKNMASLFPDKPEIIKKLMITPPGPPWH